MLQFNQGAKMARAKSTQLDRENFVDVNHPQLGRVRIASHQVMTSYKQDKWFSIDQQGTVNSALFQSDDQKMEWRIKKQDRHVTKAYIQFDITATSNSLVLAPLFLWLKTLEWMPNGGGSTLIAL